MEVNPMHFPDHQLHTMPEAAARLRVCKRTLERLIAAKEFPAPLQIGGRRLVPVADVVAYVERLMSQRKGAGVRP
jgi:excisionase family DNA binding protein